MSGYYVGDSGTIVCDVGYELSHDAIYLCESDGEWYIFYRGNNAVPTCEKSQGDYIVTNKSI